MGCLCQCDSPPAPATVSARFSFLPPNPPHSCLCPAPPAPQLFYLCADVCQKMNLKESRTLGKDIWNIFLEKNAVRVGVEQCLPGAPLLRGKAGAAWKWP